MAVTTTNLGVITAYGDAVAAGYTGTKAEWQALMASYATVGQQAVDAKNDAVAAKDTAVAKATEATTAASTATTKANEASASAQSIAQSAAQIQENTDSIDQLKSEFTALTSDGVVPSTEQILTDKGVTDSVPYHYRKTGGDGADRLYDQIVGGTVCFNQLCNDASVIVQSGRKYLSKIGTAWAVGTSTGTAITGLTSGADMIIDLTVMFGSTIADNIYSLEQATAGAGVAFFKSLFPNDYYEYNSGELVSVSGLSEHKMVGFNQWDEILEEGGINATTGELITDARYLRSKNFVSVLPNGQYYYKAPSKVLYGRLYYYDRNKNFVSYSGSSNNLNHTVTAPANAHYMKFVIVKSDYGTTYNHDICINLSDPAKNGQYKPYKAHSYPLDSTLTLRGVPKLVDGKVCFDGDVYEYTGKVTRNTILRAYQSGDESLANAITDGTNTVVYSANASTEQADPYQHLQQCDPNGTEEYVSTGIVPVGHNSFYPENLRAKVEQLPWNFASLIAPTESAFVATRNYTTGALFIVDNVLYKATSNIANGGAITPNTNCTATTLAEIISALA